MTTQEVKEKANNLMMSCPCGSGKAFYECCGAEQLNMIADEMCPCGSGKMVKDCCMKTPEDHKEIA